MIQHEDDLRNQRLGYLLTLNGLLFTALAFAWKAQAARPLVLLLAGMGIVTAASGYGSMKSSDVAIRALRDRAPVVRPKLPAEERRSEHLIELQSIPVAFASDDIRGFIKRRSARWTWGIIPPPAHALPVVFLLAWGAIVGLAIAFL